MHVYKLLDLCIVSCESRAIHMLRLLHAHVLYFKCATSTIIIEDFSYMHTIGQQKSI